MSKWNPSFEASTLMGSEVETPSHPNFGSFKSLADSYLAEPSQISSFKQSKYKTPPNNSNKKIREERQKKAWQWTEGESTKKRVNASKLTKRFEDFQGKVRQKIRKLAQELEEVQTKECTFTPSLKSERPPRTLKKFLEEQENFQILKQEKIERMKKEKQELKEESEVCSFTPSLLASGAKLPSNRVSEQVFEELYRESGKKRGHERNFSFIPTVNKTKKLERIETEEFLSYKEKIWSEKSFENEKKVSTISKSQKILKEKFTREFDEVFLELDSENKNRLNYMKFRNLLDRMNFIKNSPSNYYHVYEKELIIKAWHILVPDSESYVEKEELKLFLLDILNLPADLSTEKATNSIFSIEKRKNLHIIFTLFYENKTLESHTHKSVSPSSSQPRSKLTKITLKLAENLENKRKILFGDQKKEDILISEQKALHNKIEQKKEALIIEEISKCTFRPKINSKKQKKPSKSGSLSSKSTKKTPRFKTLYSLSRVRNDRLKESQTIRLQSELEKTMEECSFRPKINKSSSTRSLGVSSKKHSKTTSKKPLSALKCGIEFTHKSKSAFDTPKQAIPL